MASQARLGLRCTHRPALLQAACLPVRVVSAATALRWRRSSLHAWSLMVGQRNHLAARCWLPRRRNCALLRPFASVFSRLSLLSCTCEGHCSRSGQEGCFNTEAHSACICAGVHWHTCRA